MFYEIKVNGCYYDEWYSEAGLLKVKEEAAKLFPGKTIKITQVRR